MGNQSPDDLDERRASLFGFAVLAKTDISPFNLQEISQANFPGKQAAG